MNTETFNYILSRQSGRTAVDILTYMVEQGRPDIRPDAMTLNNALSAAEDCDEAMRLLEYWRALYQQGKVAEDADVVSHNTVLNALVRSKRMIEAEEFFGTYDHDAVSYGSLMRGYAEQGLVSQVVALLKQMRDVDLTPSTECFNEVLHAHSKSKLPSRTEEFLLWWLRESEDDARPDVCSFNIVLHALAQIGSDASIERAQSLFENMPSRDEVTYTTLVAACSKLSSSSKALGSIERIIKRMWQDDSIRVDSTVVANLLFSLARIEVQSMPDSATALIDEMKARRLPIELAVFNALVHCWSRSGRRDASTQALRILTMLETRKKPEPDIRTYTSVLDCLAKSREKSSFSEAEALLNRMESLGPKPNTVAYTALIQSYARSTFPDKASKAHNVLNRMDAAPWPGAKPNIVSYNLVLNAAEHSDTTELSVVEDALKVACLTFDEIRTAPVQPNHITFGTFLGVLAKLMPYASRQEIVGLVFRRACIEGQVSPLVIKKLKEATETEENFRNVLDGHPSNRLPKEWTQNVSNWSARKMRVDSG